jgi:hypothetical protein
MSSDFAGAKDITVSFYDKAIIGDIIIVTNILPSAF